MSHRLSVLRPHLFSLALVAGAVPSCTCGGDAAAPAEGSAGAAAGGEASGSGEGSAAAADCTTAHPDAVAFVDCVPVMTAAELSAQVAEMVERYERLPGREPTAAAWRNERRRRVVRSEVQQQLLAGWVSSRGIQVTDEEVTARMREELEHVYDDERLFARFLESHGTTREAYVEEIRTELAIDRALAERGAIEPTEEDITAFYEQNKERWREGERVQARAITIRVREDAPEDQVADARTRIEAIRARVTTGGEDFATVASAESESADRVRGGDRGWIVRGRGAQMTPEVERILFAAQTDTVTEPVRSELGFQIFQVMDHRPEGYRELDEVSDVLRDPLRRRNRDRLSREVENELMQSADVVYVEANWGLEAEAAGGGAPADGSGDSPTSPAPGSRPFGGPTGGAPALRHAPGGSGPVGAGPGGATRPGPGGATPPLGTDPRGAAPAPGAAAPGAASAAPISPTGAPPATAPPAAAGPGGH